MDCKLKVPTEIIETADVYENGANVPTHIVTHKCFCGAGVILHKSIFGFGENHFVINCGECEKKYSMIEQSGNNWYVYIK